MGALLLKKIRDKINTSLSNPLVKSMLIVAVIGVLIKAIAFYKETIIAGSFGLGTTIDTFLVAILVPTFIQSVFINSLKNLFIPNYIAELKNNGNKGSFQALIILITIGISIVSCIIAFFGTDLFLNLVYSEFPESYYPLIKAQLYFVVPCLFFWGISSVLAGLLEVSNRFLVATLAELFPLLTMIFFLIFLKENFGHMVLAYGTFAGSIIGLIYLLFFSIKFNDFALSKPVMNKNSRMMVRQLPPKISSSFLSAMNNYIDQFFVGQLVIGSLAALNYGNRLPAFGVTIVIMALGSVLLPHFSRLVNEDLRSAYNQLFRTLKLVLGIGLILIVIGIFMSDWIVELWLERGEFTHQDTLKVSGIQQILLVSVPFNLCTLVMVKFLTSINKNNFMAWISLANLVLNIVLNFILIKYFDVYGLVMSTTIVLILGSLFYFSYTYKQFKKIQ
ncbi:polysaccharide biosynthesis C-terminal domain-containing protein [Winogradskyella eckloniae]|uniref:murein biosynthesis integral membrane protein MurJ n=1 Tax=Winogradskyella eckloniae TaxID=1089306 RepID=UPI0015677719|nr:lipid II flippase MurJ [Winogradskyella eckloniae]NRD20147.1 polysaccharide biosynthesis C-terminal domain-containing protein [Winogradskyella eckloniae]